MTTHQRAKRIAKTLEPDAGWWKAESGRTVAVAAGKMLTAGMTEEQVEQILGDVVFAIREEYGD